LQQMQQTIISRRAFLAASAAGVATVVLGPSVVAAATRQPGKLPAGVPREMAVYKDPSCGCCTEWVKHVEAHGFKASVHDTADMNSVKASLGVPAALRSCHTVKVGN